MMNPNMNNMMMLNQNNMNQNNEELILDLMNQNIQISNQLTMNNNMIKTMFENYNLGAFNQQKDLYNELYSIDFFPLKSGRRINVVFKDSTGIKITVIAPSDATMMELLEAFYIKFQIFAKYNDKKIEKLKNYFFIYRNLKISFDEKKTISEYGLNMNVEEIIFNLNNNVIGG